MCLVEDPAELCGVPVRYIEEYLSIKLLTRQLNKSLFVMPDLIRHLANVFLDSGLRRNDGFGIFSRQNNN